DNESDLREFVASAINQAGETFSETSRRTIVGGDGLEPARREHSNADTMLQELWGRDTPPPGAIFIVGAQTPAPLQPGTRRHVVDEPERVIDLTDQRLSGGAIGAICRRQQQTALSNPQIAKIAELSGGHPLALGYLLNAIVGAEPGEIDELLAAIPAYSG